MSNRLEFPGELPPELAELDAELASIGYEERPSFGPELEADLARAWQEMQGRRYWPVRQLLAACLAGLLLVGMGVPSARAAIIRFVTSLSVGEEAVQTPPPAPPGVVAPSVGAEADGGLPPEDDGSRTPGISSGPPPAPGPVDRYAGPEATFPEILDRDRARALVQRNYPMSFQEAGIGGTVRVLLWVDSTGTVDFANLGESSGIPELDRAALQVAPSFRFEPARRRGRAVGTWVEFDIRFEPDGEAERSDWLPELPSPGVPGGLDVAAPPLGPEWRQGAALPVVAGMGAGDFLRSALGFESGGPDLGPMEAILQGEPPAGRNPTAWRAEASRVLEEALVRAPDNPAPFLALARIRRKQGLRTEAQVLLERGLQRAQRNRGAFSPAIVADLHYERGTLVKESWLGDRYLGRIRADALPPSLCPQARSSGGATSGYASVDRLVAWNYLCPEELGQVLATRFESLAGESSVDRTVTQASFRSAAEAHPAHPGANVEILLGLADEGRWTDLLSGAQRFVSASTGHPYGLLLSGLALQRLSRSEEADAAFTRALEGLGEAEAEELQDVGVLLVEPQATEYRQLSVAEQRRWRAAFWEPLDPILATPVNERAVEHLARTTYALLRFGSTRGDPGEVWVRYGQPDEIRTFAESQDVRTEFWDFGPGPDLTFRRLAQSNAMDLTAEGQAYLDEVRELVPHRYGNAARMVSALPAQVGRFRDGEGVEVEMFTRVPVLLATGARDSLEVSLVLLADGGDTLSAARRRVPAVEGEIAVRAPAGGEVGGVVVEVYNAVTGQAAALRRAVAPLATAGGAAMSDLILTDPASSSTREVARDAAWMEPLALDRPVQTHAIGAYVELYDVGSVGSWYRLRAELQDRSTGDLRDLPIQPAGEEGFRPTWDRRPHGGGVTREFVSVWLGDVPPGRYVLRLVADIPDAGAPLTAEQPLDRR